MSLENDQFFVIGLYPKHRKEGNMTAKELWQDDEIHRIGDVYLYSSEGLWTPQFVEDALLAINRGHVVPPDGINVVNPHVAGITLSQAYETAFVETGKEPEWIEYCQLETRRSLRVERLRDKAEPLCLYSLLPYSGFCYLVVEDGMTDKATKHLGLARLARVRQLGFLQHPTVGARDSSEIIASTYSHSRFHHGLDTLAVASLIGRNCDLSDEDMRHLQFAAPMHDVLTPAGSDSVKRVAPEAFDEDASFPAIFKKEKWPEIKRQFGLHEDYLTAIILGKGILGRIIDLADKSSYLARDVEAFIPSVGSRTPDGYSDEQAIVRDLVVRNPFICGLWGDARIVDGQFVLTNPKALANFLKLRALMFKILYYNPASRFSEDVLLQFGVRYMFEKGILTEEEVLTYGDEWVTYKLNEVFGFIGLTEMSNSTFEPRVETFATREELTSREKDFLNKRDLLTHAVTRKSLTHTGVESFKVFCDGRIRSLREVLPIEVAEIEKIMSSGNPHWLYIFSIKHTSFFKFPPELMRKIKEARRKRLSE